MGRSRSGLGAQRINIVATKRKRIESRLDPGTLHSGQLPEDYSGGPDGKIQIDDRPDQDRNNKNWPIKGNSLVDPTRNYWTHRLTIAGLSSWEHESGEDSIAEIMDDPSRGSFPICPRSGLGGDLHRLFGLGCTRGKLKSDISFF